MLYWWKPWSQSSVTTWATSSWSGTFPYPHILDLAFVVGSSPSHRGQSSWANWLMPSVWSRVGKRKFHHDQSQGKSTMRWIFLNISHLRWKCKIFLAENDSFTDHINYISIPNGFGWLDCRSSHPKLQNAFWFHFVHSAAYLPAVHHDTVHFTTWNTVWCILAKQQDIGTNIFGLISDDKKKIKNQRNKQSENSKLAHSRILFMSHRAVSESKKCTNQNRKWANCF